MPHFLPITLEEVKRLGWEQVDVVLVTGDAYIDHPSFGTAVIGRTLEAAGYKVAIIPQPNWRADLRDFRKFGKPRLFFGVTSGAMDSMVNHYTAARRLRHDDAYTPGGQAGFRPDRATYVYTRILKQLYPDVPVIIAGIEASMRRLAHYDYWDDRLFPSILVDTPADLLNYGMGERTTLKIANLLNEGKGIEACYSLPQTAHLTHSPHLTYNTIELHSFEECLKSKRAEAENYHIIDLESNKIECATLIQRHGDQYVVVNPPEPPMTTDEVDASFDLPYMRLPHPKYKKRGPIPAFEMIRWSVNTHRGCFGGCSFCTISAHQGKQIASRSEDSILREVDAIVADPDFHGVLTDLGGPSANMWRMKGKNPELCRRCSRYSCSMPSMCPNLDSDHQPMIELLRKVAAHPKVKHLYVGSGIRCDLFTDDNSGWQYFRQVVLNHTSGRLKVAPEHTSDHVLALMRKPSFSLFRETKRRFDEICKQAGLRYQLIPYFISSHPGCRLEDMADLAVQMKQMRYRLEQIQDFTPTPMTISTEMYYTGIDPSTMKPVYVATTPADKADQRRLFFFYRPELKRDIVASLRRNGCEKYIQKIFLLLLLLLPLAASTQAIKHSGTHAITGRVLSSHRGVPYATLQIAGTSVGVACNDNGEYTLKIPAGHENDTIVVRSVGYNTLKVPVSQLLKKTTVRLTEQSVVLRQVEISSFRTPQQLITAAVARIDSNYQQHTARSTFFYRNWRAVDGELYLFDEAVMSILRKGYSRYADKLAYRFQNNRREMKSNYKTLLKHRLVVYDPALVEEKTGGPETVVDRMNYADNEEFYDPVSTPQASFALSSHTLSRHKFQPIQEFLDGDDVYYRLCSVGPGRISKTTLRYEYVIRKSDLAIVSITEAIDSVNMPVPPEPWINIKFDRLVITADSSIWNYDVREGEYTLTRYYNSQSNALATGDRWHINIRQRWQQCVDWRLTDFALASDTIEGEVIAVRPQTIVGAFGESDYNDDFWGQYNSIAIDQQPAWLLYNKLKKRKEGQ